MRKEELGGGGSRNEERVGCSAVVRDGTFVGWRATKSVGATGRAMGNVQNVPSLAVPGVSFLLTARV